MKTIVWFGIVLCSLCAAGEVFVGKLGEKVILKCGIASSKVYVEWHHGPDMIFNKPKSGMKRRGSSAIVSRSMDYRETNLQISRLKEEDAGKFTCIVDRKSQEHTLLVVSVSADPPGELQVGATASLLCGVRGHDSAAQQWKSPKGIKHPEHTLHLESVSPSDAGTWECVFSHEGVEYKESLVIKVKEPEAAAPTQKPPKSTPIHGSVPQYPPGVSQSPSVTSLLLGLRWWVWVAVGVGFLVVFLLVVLVIVLCKRIKRRKRRYLKMKMGRLPLQPKQFCQCARPAAAEKPRQGRRREKPKAPPPVAAANVET
ncbi:CD4-2 molecule, tandem duplicate 2 [Trematomus bernacchii]|uniref:CD4-2 molecule, tandem duplicate 2 n=1 Tax=Trematomus bernacchii TaxID=40690 RepID=UPI00146DB55F|nr:CD4-2 molecule, tandem duplicate 2 [Trematomus bernacchii]XP_034001667.1 CD4-2 molecule, tandem duplicate 2 [Trematomus bernacchii]XP_034001669.1 CD4-2 molecule, tandem duplicate 2 [Trematomus bernacchii]